MSDAEEMPPEQPLRPNLKTQTLGGVQFWGDVAFFHGWHIQKNVFTGHFRLLDEQDVRHCWGTREECEAKLKEIAEKKQIPPMKGSAVVFLHGLGRSDKSVSRMRAHFADQGYYAISINYPSLRAGVKENAEHLHQVLQSLEGIDKIYLVGFSMGGVVCRQCLADHPDKRVERVVFVGSPHYGAELATMFKDWWVFKMTAGPAGQELATAPHGLAPDIAIPTCEFGVVAGCKGTDEGYNPLIPGDDDGVVSIVSTRLVGAKDFITFQCMHPILLHTPEVFDSVQRFLEKGHFRESQELNPIVAESPARPMPKVMQSE